MLLTWELKNFTNRKIELQKIIKTKNPETASTCIMAPRSFIIKPQLTQYLYLRTGFNLNHFTEPIILPLAQIK